MAGPEDATNFGVWDYVVFGCMLLISLSIGIYYGCTGGKQRTTAEFLLADRSMNPIPVAMSMVASFISAITFLGTPAEVYINGSMFWVFSLCFPMVALVVSRLFIPVFFRLNVTSVNEYLELRFNKALRVSAAVTYFFNMVFYMGIVIYAPALAFNAVTNVSLWGSVLAMGLVCTLYTTIGGMKAVLWTDVFQTCVMFGGFLAVIIEGTIRVGGLGNVWQIAEEGGRIDFWNFNFDPTIRHTFWAIVIGGTFSRTSSFAVDQSQVQRYLATGSIKRANISLCLAVFGMAFVLTISCLSGVVMYSYYADKQCDPFTSGKVSQTDQLIPYFIIELFGRIPGLPGFFTSAVFSAALSTVSSGLNALAAVTAEDLVKPCLPRISQERYTLVTKGIAFGFGLLCILLAYVISLLNQGVLQLTLSIFGMTGGPLLGLYCLGLFFPWTNSKGAMAGLLGGLAVACWVGIGAFIYPPSTYRPPLTIEGCNLTTSITTPSPLLMTTTTTLAPETSPIIELYSLSYAWYSCAFWLVTIVVGLLVSFLTGATKRQDIDPVLRSHCVDGLYCCLPEVIKKPLRCGDEKPDYTKKDEEAEMVEVKEVKPDLSDNADDSDDVDSATVATEQPSSTEKENSLENNGFTAL
ncbi:sodium-coupled monocarboxylate transporter 1-like [Acanthaster planci]|uniref:Sodium-coupled monocarboxylate transporter 1-like n=1 Tax=Acanthaster planci TaxID=133434 RepID=A0A8B7YC48_ACAPL|nr:sodium-coupled monocarboxylate transporter 1-like [Acanthaster planci]